jgi:hypothetical protein
MNVHYYYYIESNVGSIQKVDLGQGADNYNIGF